MVPSYDSNLRPVNRKSVAPPISKHLLTYLLSVLCRGIYIVFDARCILYKSFTPSSYSRSRCYDLKLGVSVIYMNKLVIHNQKCYFKV